MHIRKFRWSKVYESAEEELVQLLERKQISARRWSAGDESDTITKDFSVDSRLWCAEGQLTCTIADKTYSLQSGDVLDIPANVSCSIRVSFGGCVCYESPAERAAPSL